MKGDDGRLSIWFVRRDGGEVFTVEEVAEAEKHHCCLIAAREGRGISRVYELSTVRYFWQFLRRMERCLAGLTGVGCGAKTGEAFARV